MSMVFKFPAETDNPQRPPRGAAAVGQLHEVQPIELAAILYLRSWCAGGVSKHQIGQDFRLLLGGEAAARAMADFDDLMHTTLRAGRRPMMRHSLGCRCFCGDENAFAQMIAAASVQDQDDALLFACTLMTAPAAFEAVRLAVLLAPVFLRIARTPMPGSDLIHKPSPSSSTH